MGLGDKEGASSQTHWAPRALEQAGLSSLSVVRVDCVEEVLQFFLIEDAICKEELEFLQGQLPIVCKEGRQKGEQLVSER